MLKLASSVRAAGRLDIKILRRICRERARTQARRKVRADSLSKKRRENPLGRSASRRAARFSATSTRNSTDFVRTLSQCAPVRPFTSGGRCSISFDVFGDLLIVNKNLLFARKAPRSTLRRVPLLGNASRMRALHRKIRSSNAVAASRENAQSRIAARRYSVSRGGFIRAFHSFSYPISLSFSAMLFET